MGEVDAAIIRIVVRTLEALNSGKALCGRRPSGSAGRRATVGAVGGTTVGTENLGSLGKEFLLSCLIQSGKERATIALMLALAEIATVDTLLDLSNKCFHFIVSCNIGFSGRGRLNGVKVHVKFLFQLANSTVADCTLP